MQMLQKLIRLVLVYTIIFLKHFAMMYFTITKYTLYQGKNKSSTSRQEVTSFLFTRIILTEKHINQLVALH